MSEMAKVLRIDGGFGFEHVKLEEWAVPEPGAGEVLVRFRAGSLNFRDLWIVKGQYNPRMKMPKTLGSDAAGDVLAVGAGVTRCKVGDRVTSLFFQRWETGPTPADAMRHALGESIDGVFATHRVLPENGVIRTPDYLTDEEAATLPCAGLTAWDALVAVGGLKPGETVLTLGTGGVSLFALQMAKALGAKVIATSSSDEKLERARALGADETINYRTTPEWGKEVRRLTGKRGVDHVVEVGGAGTMEQSLQAVRSGGRIDLIGLLAAGQPGSGGADLMPVLMKALKVEGILVGSREMFEAMNRMLEANRLKPVLDRVFELNEAVAALKYMEAGSHFGKIVLRLD